jgi:hypothetical protein
MTCMTAQQWINANPWALFFLIPLSFFGMFFLISQISGWSRLAQRFSATEPFSGEIWRGQSARFRFYCGYNNCLTVGATQEALYLSVMIPFRIFHPPLLIPWQEIEAEKGKAFFGLYDTVIFRIGTEERITMRIQSKLANRLRQTAGHNWPLYAIEQMQAQAGQ